MFSVSHSHMFLRWRRVFSRTFGFEARRSPSPLYYSAHFDPGQASWRVLWASKVTRTDSFSRGYAPPRRAKQGYGNPNYQLRNVFALLCCCIRYTYDTALKISMVWGSHSTTAAALLHGPSVIATNGASACVRVRVRVRVRDCACGWLAACPLCAKINHR